MLEFFNKYVIGLTVPAALILCGIYFLFLLRFKPLLRAPNEIVKSFGKGGGGFRALGLSLAGTLGVGNLAGVASAIYMGGFGSVFWLWVSAVVASILKYAEVLLAMLHRRPTENGFLGGAAYYISDGISGRSPLLARLLSRLFALLCVINCFFMGGVIQTNAVSEALELGFSIPRLISGALISAAVLFLLLGGGKRIMRLTSALVPFMSAVYLVLSLAVLLRGRGELQKILRLVFYEAFSFRAMGGGILGFLLSKSLRFGVMRGLFSNEAGCGTSPTAHITSNLPPCMQGVIGLFEVFIDTVLLCSLTAFTVMLGYDSAEVFGNNPILMTVAAYTAGLPRPISSICPQIMGAMVFCFGFATLSCLAHYTLECGKFISKRPLFIRTIALAYVLSVFAGAICSTELAWGISDVTVGLMTLINLFALLIFSKEIKTETLSYFERRRKS